MSPARLDAGAAALIALCSCAQHELAPHERDQLGAFGLDDLPAASINAYVDRPEAIALGHRMFFDPALSGPLAGDSDLGGAGDRGKVSCDLCHDVGTSGADPRGMPRSLGAGGMTDRNAPTLFNAAWRPFYPWDGEYRQMTDLLRVPFFKKPHNLHPVELAELVQAGYELPYVSLFGPFPSSLGERPPRLGPQTWYDGLTGHEQRGVDDVVDNTFRAIEAYVRQLRSDRSPLELYLAGEGELDDDALRGAKLFLGKAGCARCHYGAGFSDRDFHVVGLDQREVDDGGCVKDEALPRFDWRRDAYADTCKVGAFATPPLHDVALTAPYMHDGSLETLEDVVAFYDRGGDPGGFPGERDGFMEPLTLTDDERSALVAFLASLTGEHGPEWALRPPQAGL